MSSPAVTAAEEELAKAQAAAAETTKADGEPLSKNEKKKRAKAVQRAEKKLKKAQAKAAKAAAAPAKKKAAKEEEDAVEPWKYFENRSNLVTSMEQKFEQGERKDAALNPYPHKFQVSSSIPAYREEWDVEGKLSNGEHKEGVVVSLAGRIVGIRGAGKLVFIVLQGDGMRVQLMSSRREYAAGEDAFDSVHRMLRRGDIVGCTGSPSRSRSGELSVLVTHLQVLSPCLRMLPKDQGNKAMFTSQDARYRQRYLDLIMNQTSRNVFITRAKIINYIRRYLDNMDFLEVETPVLNMIPGGATARPFETLHNELNMKMFMRIAPELYLKTLIIGGLDRVYEIGRQFRNEGMDMTHNPEFTTCEFYMAYADYHDLMDMTEDMLRGMVREITGGTTITYHPNRDENGPGEPITIDFGPKFERYPMVETIEDRGGFTLPRPLTSDECNEFLKVKCAELEIECKPPTTAKLLDKLVEHYLESEIQERPTFIIDHPEIMSPLAKYHRSKPEMTERFELFINGKELCNAYTELNNPRVQRERFEEQARQKAAGDDEAQFKDENYLRAMEYGLAPTGGWGLGVDRLTMFLSDNNTIKEVLLFPAMKPEAQGSAAGASKSAEAEAPAAPEAAAAPAAAAASE